MKNTDYSSAEKEQQLGVVLKRWLGAILLVNLLVGGLIIFLIIQLRQARSVMQARMEEFNQQFRRTEELRKQDHFFDDNDNLQAQPQLRSSPGILRELLRNRVSDDE